MQLLIGSHVSFKKEKQLLGCVEETLSYGANTFMFYTGAPQNTLRNQIDDNLTNKAIKLMQENDIDKDKIVVHAPYIINLASNENDFAISFLKQEIKRCEQLQIKYIGSLHKKYGSCFLATILLAVILSVKKCFPGSFSACQLLKRFLQFRLKPERSRLQFLQ